ncbi:uncharacterized protein PAC_03326 [Phialocephala subalpina]|uniref:Uncharacterized protein n=1 Tax=Phialocephala subalpina TaxID=576137 RepID=A0A1L7WL10_9HELO|nr:uncharacterized protein PAC_03326 [Phialocephala subalpina]
MLQITANRVCAVSAFSLFITILMYETLTHVKFRTPVPEKIVSGWGDGWASLLAPGEPFERTTLRSPSGQFVFSIGKDGHLLFEDRKLKKNTTLFSQNGDGIHGLGDGVHVPESATWHASPEVPTPRVVRSSPTQIEDKRGDEDLGDLLQGIQEDGGSGGGEEDDQDVKNNGLGFLSITAWDSNRLSNCYMLPKHTAANSAPFLSLYDTGLLQISTANEINCVLKGPEEEKVRKLRN